MLRLAASLSALSLVARRRNRVSTDQPASRSDNAGANAFLVPGLPPAATTSACGARAALETAGLRLLQRQKQPIQPDAESDRRDRGARAQAFEQIVVAPAAAYVADLRSRFLAKISNRKSGVVFEAAPQSDIELQRRRLLPIGVEVAQPCFASLQNRLDRGDAKFAEVFANGLERRLGLGADVQQRRDAFDQFGRNRFGLLRGAADQPFDDFFRRPSADMTHVGESKHLLDQQLGLAGLHCASSDASSPNSFAARRGASAAGAAMRGSFWLRSVMRRIRVFDRSLIGKLVDEGVADIDVADFDRRLGQARGVQRIQRRGKNFGVGRFAALGAPMNSAPA